MKTDTAVLDKVTEQTKSEGENGPLFGRGKYSQLMGELYTDCQRVLGLTPKQAEKVARAYASEVGRIDATSDGLKHKIGKLNKDGMLTVAESVKLKGLHLTPALACAKLCAELDGLKKFWLMLGPKGGSEIVLHDNIVSWLTSE